MSSSQVEATHVPDAAFRKAVVEKKKAAACEEDDKSTLISKNWSKRQKIRPCGFRSHPDVNNSDTPWSQSEVGLMWKSRGEIVSAFNSKNKKFLPNL